MDERAFARTAEEYATRLFAVAYRLLGNRSDAEDAVQRALLKAYEARESYSSRWAVSTWLYRVLTNVCIDELRRRRRTPPEPLPRARAATAVERLDLTRALDTVPRAAWYGFILDGVTTARPPALALTPSAPGGSCANTWRAGARSSRWRSTSAASGSFSPACWPKPSAFRSARSIPIRPSRDGWAIREPPARSATRSGPTRCR